MRFAQRDGANASHQQTSSKHPFFLNRWSSKSCHYWSMAWFSRENLRKPLSFPCYIYWLVVLRLPLWKIWVRHLGWWNSQLNGKIIQSWAYEIPNWMESHKFMFQTTNQYRIFLFILPLQKTLVQELRSRLGSRHPFILCDQSAAGFTLWLFNIAMV